MPATIAEVHYVHMCRTKSFQSVCDLRTVFTVMPNEKWGDLRPVSGEEQFADPSTYSPGVRTYCLASFPSALCSSRSFVVYSWGGVGHVPTVKDQL